MQKLKAWFDVLMKSQSCSLGIAMNALLFLAVGALQIFPPDSIHWAFPTWFIATLFLLGILLPVAVVLVINDLLKGQRFLAMIGAVICFWPLLLLWIIENVSVS